MAIEVTACISNHVSHGIIDVITYPRHIISQSLLAIEGLNASNFYVFKCGHILG